jgi:heptosyltransferase-2
VKILVRSTNWVGDAVMSIPALEVVRGHWPQAEVAILARPWVADLYRGQGLADRLLIFDRAGRHRGLLGLEHLAAELRRERFDAALLFQNAFQAAWLAWRAGIPERIGYARDARSWLLTRAVAVPKPGEIPAHESYYYLELLRRAGWLERLTPVEAIRLRVAPEALHRAEGLLRAAGARTGAVRVAVAPGAAYGTAKCWAAERYAALADRLIADFDADVVLFGAASERDVAARIAAAMAHHPVLLAGQTAIGDLPALLASCHLFVGNDSGAMHVAAAVGLPVVAIFGPTDPQGTAPVTPRWTLVRQPVACSPCFLRHCPIDHRCMTRVSVDQVYAAAREWVASRNHERV